jgi:hypothetical protein
VEEMRLGFEWVKVVLKALFILIVKNLEFEKAIKFEIVAKQKQNNGE